MIQNSPSSSQISDLDGKKNTKVALILSDHTERYASLLCEEDADALRQEMDLPVQQQLDLITELALSRILVKDLVIQYKSCYNILKEEMNKPKPIKATIATYTLLANDARKHLQDAISRTKDIVRDSITLNNEASKELTPVKVNTMLKELVKIVKDNVMDQDFSNQFEELVATEFTVANIASGQTTITTDQEVIGMDDTVPYVHTENTSTINTPAVEVEEDKPKDKLDTTSEEASNIDHDSDLLDFKPNQINPNGTTH